VPHICSPRCLSHVRPYTTQSELKNACLEVVDRTCDLSANEGLALKGLRDEFVSLRLFAQCLIAVQSNVVKQDTKDPMGHWQSIQVCYNDDIRLGLRPICSSAVLQVALSIAFSVVDSASPSLKPILDMSPLVSVCRAVVTCLLRSWFKEMNENHMSNCLILQAIASVALQIGRICLNKHVRASGVRPSQNVCALN
jgi:hypothetical protein